MKSLWNQRYSAEDYVYGQEPNEFFKENIEIIKPGKILFPGEGEGRNAVYAAKLGWEVTAFDSAVQGKVKAEKLAQQFNVSINYLVEDADTINLPENSFDCIVFIFIHVPEEKRRYFHRKMLKFLKPGGIILFEGFEKKQISLHTGGPKLETMLFSKKDLETDFGELNTCTIEERTTEINEGLFHKGKAHVVRLIGKK